MKAIVTRANGNKWTRFKIDSLNFALMKNVLSELPISGEIAGNVENLVAFFQFL